MENARLAAAVLVRGKRDDAPLLVRWDASFPTLFQLRMRGITATPISYATAHIAALFVKHFQRDSGGVFPPEALPIEVRRKILAEARLRDIRIRLKLTPLKHAEEDEEIRGRRAIHACHFAGGHGIRMSLRRRIRFPIELQSVEFKVPGPSELVPETGRRHGCI